ncbi:MAG: hydroxymethylbilane synthase [Betaproteobacteria bacterium RIFCSPLOWO2_02_FULL_65_24]|nr:MAG: hydroxymethylbilane synthase [Betaproteobacteria bacterium RIFCSPLOWO2_02_FULL_65_24]OGA95286.1 MAG: hydroxymethylbilane synthase [Betaproteobacteria bacterium RIFCSPLOWO2_12_FULL_66_14]
MWQATHVRGLLGALYPSCGIDILGMTTSGDRLLDATLQQLGGKGLFVKELESALLERRADLAVHSAKDMPMDVPPGFRIAAITAREDARDALVSQRYAALEDMPPGTRVGTSSLRREAQLRERFPRLHIVPVRGNLDTRLAKLDRGEYDALVLAAAGLKRLGLASRIRTTIETERCLPAPGQGALAIECLADRQEIAELLAPLEDEASAACVRAERAVSAALSGNCRLPLAAYARLDGGQLHLRGMVAAADGRKVIRAEARGAPDCAEELGAQLAAELKARGADAILAALHG